LSVRYISQYLRKSHNWFGEKWEFEPRTICEVDWDAHKIVIWDPNQKFSLPQIDINRPVFSIRIGSSPASWSYTITVFYNVLFYGHKQISGSDILNSLIEGYDLPLAGLTPKLQQCAGTRKIPLPTNKELLLTFSYT